jgi:hypothetical protein
MCLVDNKTLTEKQLHMQTITHDGLKTILEGHGTQAEVTVASVTVPRMRKTNNPYYDRVKKHSIVVGDICFNYENEVNKQRHRESTLSLVAGVPTQQPVTEFKAQSRTWGDKEQTRERIGALVYHGADAYLELLVKQSVRHEYRDSEGNVVDRSVLEPFIYKAPKPQTQQTDKEIIVRDYKLTNIVSIVLAGRVYKI